MSQISLYTYTERHLRDDGLPDKPYWMCTECGTVVYDQRTFHPEGTTVYDVLEYHHMTTHPGLWLRSRPTEYLTERRDSLARELAEDPDPGSQAGYDAICAEIERRETGEPS